MTNIIQCTLISLRAWGKLEEQENRSTPFTKIMQNMEGFQSLITYINIWYKQSNIRSIWKTGTNAQCDYILRPLKYKSAIMDEWVRTSVDIDPNDYVVGAMANNLDIQISIAIVLHVGKEVL